MKRKSVVSPGFLIKYWTIVAVLTAVTIFVGNIYDKEPEKILRLFRNDYILDLKRCPCDDAAYCLDQEDAVRLQMILASYREDPGP